jgi:PIN domain nuclease of toxin-antitoxin system
VKAPLLLDTCAVIWIANGDPIAGAATNALSKAQQSHEPVFVSPITAWEIGLLVARGRLKLLVSPSRWFQRFVDVPGVQLAEMSPEVLIASSFLPGAPPKDPADRIVAATAREFGYQLMTRDQLLLTYGEQGHIRVQPC